MRVIGVDPGYDKFGVAILQGDSGKEEVIFSDCLRSESKQPFSERLFSLGDKFDALIKKYKPEALAIEKLFFTTNQKTAMGVSEIKGMATYISKLNKLEIFEYTPLQVKSSLVGYGKASKEQVAKMIPLLLKNFNKMNKKHLEDDEYDAIAISLTCLAMERGLARKNKF